MKFNGLSQFKLLVCTALLVSFSRSAQALIPVTDPGTLAQTIENNINLGLEFKEVKKVMELAGTMNTTIGDSIKSFHEYVDTYNKYKDTINGALDTASKYAGMADGVLGTNLGGLVDGAQGVTDKATGVGDKVVGSGENVANIGNKVQGGINSGNKVIDDIKGGTISKEGEKLQGKVDKAKDGWNKLTGKNKNKTETAENSGSNNGTVGSAAGGGSGTTTGGGGTGGMGMTSNLTGPGTNSGYAVLPNELADYCGISVSDIDDVAKKGVVVNCLKKLITYRNSKTLEDQRSARDIYVKSFHETAYANVAEAVVMRNYAVNYEREVLKPLSEKLKKAKTVRDDYSGVVMVNKEIANMLNRILMVYASKVSYDALRDYGEFEIYPDDLLQLD